MEFSLFYNSPLGYIHSPDVSRYSEKWDDRGTEDLNLTIPLLMQNKVPDGFETDDRLDVSIRPDTVSCHSQFLIRNQKTGETKICIDNAEV